MESIEILICDGELPDCKVKDIPKDIYNIFLSSHTAIDPLDKNYYMSEPFELLLGDDCLVEGDPQCSEVRLSFDGEEGYKLKEKFLYVSLADDELREERYSSISHFLRSYESTSRKS